MCGICGYISKKKIDADELVNMTNSMTKRGPDGYGIFQEQMMNYYIGFGHRRLSIFDLTNRGKQPMVSDDGKIVITYNGEIYNFKNIRRELTLKGYVFKSECDTEVILNAYREWGVDSFPKFNGMFAFGILDKDKGRLILCRDRLGVKPLYYYAGTDISVSDFCFASELAAIVRWQNFSKAIDYAALHFFLWNMYIPAPKTIFKDTYKLEPGSYLEISIHTGEKRIYKWWHPYQIYDKGELKLSQQDWLERIESELSDAVKIRLEADVPVGIFLSGGIDSSLVTALACETGKKINTFSIGFNEKDFDEAGYAKEIADILGTNHHNLYCSINDAKNIIKEIPKAYSEPFADNSQIPMLLLSGLTRENVTVSLSGDGGDELFGGYPHVQDSFRWYKKMWLYSVAGDALYKLNSHFDQDGEYSYKAWRYRKLSNISSRKNIRYLDYLTADKLIKSILKDEVHTEIGSLVNDMVNVMESDLPDTDFVSQFLLRDMRYGLPDDMLTKVDRATMYYSLEARTPILDYRIVEDAIRMPVEIKYKDNTLKYVLKELLYRKVPKKVVDRPKQGFGIPINKWLHEEEFFEVFDKYFNPNWIKRQSIFSVSGVYTLEESFKKQHNPILGRIVWTYINFQMWWEEYVA